MPHQISISEEDFKWLKNKAGGNKQYHRYVDRLFAVIRAWDGDLPWPPQMQHGAPIAQSTPESTPQSTITGRWDAVNNVRTTGDLSAAARTVLNSNWNFIDPRGYMRKTPEEVKRIMEDHAYGYLHGKAYNKTAEPYRSLLDLIFQSFLAYTCSGGQ